MNYQPATDDMIAAVQDCIRQHHRHLARVRVAVVAQEKAGEQGGKWILACASKPQPRVLPLLKHPDTAFLVCIALDKWMDAKPEKRAAIIDHELCHCILDDKGKPQIRPHDYEEFAEIIERHGFWRGDYSEGAVQSALEGMERECTPQVDTLAEVEGGAK